jgi:hypothetical protein
MVTTGEPAALFILTPIDTIPTNQRDGGVSSKTLSGILARGFCGNARSIMTLGDQKGMLS